MQSAALLIHGAIALFAQDGAAPTPAPAARPSVQQLFDAASAAAEADRCAEAEAGFAAVEPRVLASRNPVVLATVRARRGVCLEKLGRDAEARAALEHAIATLSADDAAQAGDLLYARMALGRVHHRAHAFGRARAEFAAALAASPEGTRLQPLIWLARASAFEEQDAGLAHADAALAIALTGGRENRPSIAVARTVRARILLNKGDHGGAFAELRRAVSEQGGLDSSVTPSELVTRADVALAATLVGDRAEAQRYIAYTGAGRLEGAPFTRAVDMAPPPCGEEAGLQPDDRAIVEFGITEAGAVSYAMPIYVSRGGDRAAAAFADAVRNWSWREETVAGIAPLFRALTRVELRCSVASSGLDAGALLDAALDEWLAGQGVAAFDPQGSELARLTQADAELARRRAAGGGIALIPVLRVVSRNGVAQSEAMRGSAEEAIALARSAGAPAAALVALELAAEPESDSDDRLRRYTALLDRPDVAADALAAAALRLTVVQNQTWRRRRGDARPMLQAVVDDARLPAGHPLRVSALVQLANLQAAAGDLDGARASYAATGLDAQQCSLVDARPAERRSGASSSDFPMEATRWGFEGWTRVEYDIAADGRTSNQRTVIAYPPFVFTDAATGILRDARFTQSYRPEGGPGCGGASRSILFSLPD